MSFQEKQKETQTCHIEVQLKHATLKFQRIVAQYKSTSNVARTQKQQREIHE